MIRSLWNIFFADQGDAVEIADELSRTGTAIDRTRSVQGSTTSNYLEDFMRNFESCKPEFTEKFGQSEFGTSAFQEYLMRYRGQPKAASLASSIRSYDVSIALECATPISWRVKNAKGHVYIQRGASTYLCVCTVLSTVEIREQACDDRRSRKACTSNTPCDGDRCFEQDLDKPRCCKWRAQAYAEGQRGHWHRMVRAVGSL